jgi:hypothetical protein
MTITVQMAILGSEADALEHLIGEAIAGIEQPAPDGGANDRGNDHRHEDDGAIDVARSLGQVMGVDGNRQWNEHGERQQADDIDAGITQGLPEFG